VALIKQSSPPFCICFFLYLSQPTQMQLSIETCWADSADGENAHPRTRRQMAFQTYTQGCSQKTMWRG